MAKTGAQSIFDIEPDEAEEVRLDAEADTDFAAAQVEQHAKVVEWLKSWGTPDVLPCPTSKPR
jgi:hypothetical protein